MCRYFDTMFLFKILVTLLIADKIEDTKNYKNSQNIISYHFILCHFSSHKHQIFMMTSWFDVV